MCATGERGRSLPSCPPSPGIHPEYPGCSRTQGGTGCGKRTAWESSLPTFKVKATGRRTIDDCSPSGCFPGKGLLLLWLGSLEGPWALCGSPRLRLGHPTGPPEPLPRPVSPATFDPSLHPGANYGSPPQLLCGSSHLPPPPTSPVVPPDSETTMFRVSLPPGTVVCEAAHARILQEAPVGHFSV